ncbi:DEAD/DEAH box helicase [Neobacillus drentensis]|uniref:DEAD/DEAH box helicase n=1 Tax=Neobacillus drentensis TaxID=220684 RepID=UPI002FFEA20E
MKIPLKGFQEDARDNLLSQINHAKDEIKRTGEAQAVTLSSPTGSGKTVIITEVMEILLEGNEKFSAESDSVFLWLSDQPELNKQSKGKVIECSDRIREKDIIIIDSDFDQETFDAGKLYFVNTQKLAKDNLLSSPGDKRSFTIWETINNTQEEYKEKFCLIIDEAHRGMKLSTHDQKISKTIVQKFIFGDEVTGLNPVKLIIGISATPERFERLLEDSQHQLSRTRRLTHIDPETVRGSGLIKEKIITFYPKNPSETDWTMLSAAVRHWKQVRSSWDEFTSKQEIPPVQPAMVIQVEDRSDSSISRTDLESLFRVLEEEVGTINENEIVHCFDDDMDVPVGNRRIRKMDASQIQKAKEVKFILFKMSLTTGWDCPRAEVMMSFRPAQDHTLIAQLIGRMIRTPLGESVEGNELLNSVSLYLPHYNRENLRKVVEYLKSDKDNVPFSDVEDGNITIWVKRSDKYEKLYRELEKLPNQKVYNHRRVSHMRRLLKLSRLLTFDGIDVDALEGSKKLIVQTLFEEKEDLKRNDPEFKKQIEESTEIEIFPVEIEQGLWKEIDKEPIKVPLTDQNIEQLFQKCGKRLGEGIHMDYWTTYYDSENPNRPKLELFLTSQRQDIYDTLEQICEVRINQLTRDNNPSIRKLNRQQIEKYDQIQLKSKTPEILPFYPPLQFLVKSDENDPNFAYYDKHIYVTEDDNFSTVLNSWERQTIEEEIIKDNVVGWLRNIDRRSWAFTIPYTDGGRTRSLFPDFLVIRKENESYVVDILEPHRDDKDDNWKKAVGLAQFAKDYWNSFGRIQMIRKRGTVLKRLEFNNPVVREHILSVKNNEHLNTIFNVYAQ